MRHLWDKKISVNYFIVDNSLRWFQYKPSTQKAIRLLDRQVFLERWSNVDGIRAPSNETICIEGFQLKWARIRIFLTYCIYFVTVYLMTLTLNRTKSTLFAIIVFASIFLFTTHVNIGIFRTLSRIARRKPKQLDEETL